MQAGRNVEGQPLQRADGMPAGVHVLWPALASKRPPPSGLLSVVSWDACQARHIRNDQ